MKIMRRMAAAAMALALGIGLAACTPQPEPHATAAPAAVVSQGPLPVTTAPATVIDSAKLWCGKLSALGTSGTADQYREIAAELSDNKLHVTLAAAALRLHDKTGTSINPVDTTYEKSEMIKAVLDLAEECLKVTG